MPDDRSGPSTSADEEARQLAPVALFVYRRPEHTRKTLDALAANRRAAETDLVIFSDGPKSEADREGVLAVRSLVAGAAGFRSVEIREREDNIGLAQSIISGVTSILETHERVIVIEDDLVTHPAALDYFNRCLDHFADNPGVFSISGYNHPPRIMPVPPDYGFDVYAIPRMQCWGWATWRDRWAKADFSVPDFDAFDASATATEACAYWIGTDSVDTLRACMKDGKDVWACRFGYIHFKHHAVCICPTRSLVDNIGFDGSGSNCGTSDRLRQDIGAYRHEAWRLPDQAMVDPRIFEAFMAVMDPRHPMRSPAAGKTPGLTRRLASLARDPRRLAHRLGQKGREALALRSPRHARRSDLEERHRRLSAPPSVPLTRLGTDYGGWWVPERGLGPSDLMISAGAGEDISFDLEVARKFGCRIVVMDPTPRAIAHFEATAKAIETGAKAPINNSKTDCYQADPDDLACIVYRPLGLWIENTKLHFHAPRNPVYVSHSIGNLQDVNDGFDADCVTLDEILSREGYQRISILKIDIEGAEFEVLDQLAASTLRPKYILAEFHPGQSEDERRDKTKTLSTLDRLFDQGYRLVQHRDWDYMLEHQA
ncbi:MAG: FkbM family methyltransferase [Geminicoccaceae bacterium]